MTRANIHDVSGFDIELDLDGLQFQFGPSMQSVPSEGRRLDAVRASLRDPECNGPSLLYTIYMDFCRQADHDRIVNDALLYGGVIYAAGAMGNEYVRSQGHRHAANSHGMSYPEVYEIWHGRALLYMQKEDGPDVTDCRIIEAGPGDIVVVPPNWVHMTANIGDEPLAFGAWVARDQKFVYDGVRERHGVAWYFLTDGTRERNPHYTSAVQPTTHHVLAYPELNIEQGLSMYEQYLAKPELLTFLTEPQRFMDTWSAMEQA